jgi:hypothetical protein
MEIISRKEAKARGLKFFFTGKPCPHGHVSKRLVSNYACYQCSQERGAEWRENNRDKARASCRNWIKNNPEKARANNHNWIKNNPEKARENSRRWAIENPGKATAKTMRRDAAKLQRTPTWADHDAIGAIYEQSGTMSDHQVDHIIPLQGELVSGLHVDYNLQIIPRSENASKKNQFDPDTFIGP